MLGRVFTLAVILGAGYWYWSGPYQQQHNPSYEQRLKKNAENMRLCMRGAAYGAGATGETSGNPEQRCAERFNLYKLDGQWHSYDDARP